MLLTIYCAKRMKTYSTVGKVLAPQLDFVSSKPVRVVFFQICELLTSAIHYERFI